MISLPIVVGSAASAYAGTNLDGLTVLSLSFLSRRRAAARSADIVLAAMLAAAALTVISLLAAAALVEAPRQVIGAIGAVPVALGLRGLHRAIKASRNPAASAPTPLATHRAVLGALLAAGGDNVAVYTGLFHAAPSTAATLCAAAVITAMPLTWCALAAALARLRPLVATADRLALWLMPTLLVTIGIRLLIEAR